MTEVGGQERFHLDDEMVAQYHEQGYLGPFKLCSPEKMRSVRKHIYSEIVPDKSDSGSSVIDYFTNRHKDCATLCNLAMDPRIVDRMASMYPNLACTSTRIWTKYPDGKEVPWHQDGVYYPFHPTITISAWVALTEATTENGCVQLIPGSHTEGLHDHKQVEDPENKRFGEEVDPKHISEDDIIDMELEPGEFFLFTDKLLHHSTKNETDRPRLGLSVRGAPSFVYVSPEDEKQGRELMMMNDAGYGTISKTVPRPSECQH